MPVPHLHRVRLRPDRGVLEFRSDTSVCFRAPTETRIGAAYRCNQTCCHCSQRELIRRIVSNVDGSIGLASGMGKYNARVRSGPDALSTCPRRGTGLDQQIDESSRNRWLQLLAVLAYEPQQCTGHHRQIADDQWQSICCPLRRRLRRPSSQLRYASVSTTVCDVPRRPARQGPSPNRVNVVCIR